MRAILKDVCEVLPNSNSCLTFLDNYLDFILEILLAQGNPDDVCAKLGICKDAGCRLYPKSAFEMTASIYLKSTAMKDSIRHDFKNLLEGAITEFPKKPIFDEDNDAFSTVEYLRGSNWRGKDCNDENPNIYPGAKISFQDPASDYNCNGISGRDPVTNHTYKDLFCRDSGQLGVAVVGGSACSHFVIREKWLDWKHIQRDSYKDLLKGLLNELDWPHHSWATGYAEDSEEYGKVDSVYKRLVERNHCNHRDYQNIAKNGASSEDSFNLLQHLKRDSKRDHPMLLFHSPLGNDICHMTVEDPLSRMTTTAAFRKNVLQSLSYLDTVLPKGSHVVFIGLVDGTILWDNLYNQTHPFGVTYEQLYSWLLCIRANPCTGWLTPNATDRYLATKRANELSDQYAYIVKEYSSRFKNFDMAYLPFPMKELIAKRVREGGKAADLIDVIDGFHPSQVLNHMLGEWIFTTLERDYPSFIGKQNLFNNKIKELFVDQGGH